MILCHAVSKGYNLVWNEVEEMIEDVKDLRVLLMLFWGASKGLSTWLWLLGSKGFHVPENGRYVIELCKVSVIVEKSEKIVGQMVVYSTEDIHICMVAEWSMSERFCESCEDCPLLHLFFR